MEKNTHDDFFSSRYRGYLWGESPSIAKKLDLAKDDLMGRQVSLTLGRKADGSLIKIESLLFAVKLAIGSERNLQAPRAMTYLQNQVRSAGDDMVLRPIEPICAFSSRMKTRAIVNSSMDLFCFKYPVARRADVELAIRRIDQTYRANHLAAQNSQARSILALG